jgi:hypothetical protein
MARLPRGRWTAQVVVVDNDPGPDGVAAATVAAQPGITVDRNTTVSLDARKAAPVSVTVPEPGARLATATVGTGQTFSNGAAVDEVDAPSGPEVKTVSGVYAAPTATHNAPGFTFYADTVWARPNGDGFAGSPYLYHALLRAAGGVPVNPVHRFTPAEFASVDNDLHSTTAGGTGRLMSWPTIRGLEGGEFGNVPVPLPGVQREYFSTLGAPHWTTQFGQSDQCGKDERLISDRPRTYRAGARTTQHWNMPVFGPGLPAYQVARFPFVVRLANTIGVQIPMFSDADPDRYGYDDRATGTVELYCDGTRVGASTDLQRARFDVPADPGTYRLVVTAKRDTVTSPTVTGEWTFPSATAASLTALPVAAVRYQVGVADDGTVPAAATRIPLVVQAQIGAATVAGVDVSYDDGATWQPTTVIRTGGGPTAVLARPGTPGAWVSLRSRVTGPGGAAGTQTVLRAYRLR